MMMIPVAVYAKIDSDSTHQEKKKHPLEGCMVKCKKKRFAEKALKCTSEKYVC